MKNLKTIYSLFAFFIVLSCSDDFVNVDSEDLNSEDFFNSEQEYQDALVAAYDYLQTTAKFYQFAEIASDNSKVSSMVKDLKLSLFCFLSQGHSARNSSIILSNLKNCSAASL